MRFTVPFSQILGHYNRFVSTGQQAGYIETHPHYIRIVQLPQKLDRSLKLGFLHGQISVHTGVHRQERNRHSNDIIPVWTLEQRYCIVLEMESYHGSSCLRNRP